MHPYRTRTSPPEDPAPPPARDDRIIYAVLGGLGALRLVVALALGEALGAEATVAGLMLAAAVFGILRRQR